MFSNTYYVWLLNNGAIVAFWEPIVKPIPHSYQAKKLILDSVSELAFQLFKKPKTTQN